MKAVQTVNVGHFAAVLPETGGQRQEAERFGPEVVGCKIMDPWIDQENVRIFRSGFHGFSVEKYFIDVFFNSLRLNSNA